MARPSNASIYKYQKRVYDQVVTKVPKGRKDDLQRYAEEKGISLNSIANDLFRNLLGMSEAEWKNRSEGENQEDE